MFKARIGAGARSVSNCMHDKELQEKVGDLRGQIQTFENQ